MVASASASAPTSGRRVCKDVPASRLLLTGSPSYSSTARERARSQAVASVTVRPSCACACLA
eukprot:3998979-Pleurochrysis_carterae.AAC.1